MVCAYKLISIKRVAEPALPPPEDAYERFWQDYKRGMRQNSLLTAEEILVFASRIKFEIEETKKLQTRLETIQTMIKNLVTDEEQLQAVLGTSSLVEPNNETEFARKRRIYIAQEATIQKALKAQQGNEAKAIALLVNANLFLVVSIVKSYARNVESFMDLIQEGNIGLVIAARTFDATKGFMFSSYATRCIKSEIFRAMAEQSRTVKVPRKTLKEINAIAKAAEAFISEHGHKPTLDDLAKETGIDPDEILRLMMDRLISVSLDRPIKTTEGPDPLTYGDVLADPAPNPEEELVLKRYILDLMTYLQRNLSPKNMQRLTDRFGLLGTDKELTFDEIAMNENTSRQNVQQGIERVLGKIHSVLISGLPLQIPRGY